MYTYHDVYFKYLIVLYVNYFPIKLKLFTHIYNKTNLEEESREKGTYMRLVTIIVCEWMGLWNLYSLIVFAFLFFCNKHAHVLMIRMVK